MTGTAHAATRPWISASNSGREAAHELSRKEVIMTDAEYLEYLRLVFDDNEE